MDNTEKVRENRARRAAARQGLAAQKSPRRDPRGFDYETWQLVEPRSGEVVASGFQSGYGLTLDQLEDLLRKAPRRATRRRT